MLEFIIGVILFWLTFKLAYYHRAITPAYNRPRLFRNPFAFTALNILARISHQPSTAMMQVLRWLRYASSGFLRRTASDTPADPSVACLAIKALASFRDER